MPLWVQRASSISKIAFIHGNAFVGSSQSPASTLWFVKVVCTVLFIHQSSNQSLAVFGSDYFRRSLDPVITFAVIHRMESKFNKPRLAFSFFQYTRLNLNLIHSLASFNLLLSSLCQLGLHDLAVLVYEYMKADGLLPDSHILGGTVSSFVNAGKSRIAKAVLIAHAEFCNQGKVIVSSLVYNNFLRLLFSRNLAHEALDFFESYVLRLQSFCPDTCSFNIVMGGLCRIGKVDKAYEFLNTMKSFGCLPDLISYNTLINGLCKVGNLDRARGLLREVQLEGRFSPNVVSYTSVISGYCKLKKMEEALSVFHEMINCKTRPNLFTFNALIDGFGKNGDVVSALKMYEMMSTFNCYPDVVTFSSLIYGHCQNGELEYGLKLWGEMNSQKLSPNLYTFSILINALCRENRLNEARDLLSQLCWREDIAPRAFIYNPVIDGFSKAGNIDEAKAIFAEMKAKRVSPDKMTYTILIIGHCMKGRMSEAISIYNKMLAMGCSPDHITLTSLTSCLRKAGMVNEAFKIEQNAGNAVDSSVSSKKKTVPITKMDVRVAI